jgi:hypothetical protein
MRRTLLAMAIGLTAMAQTTQVDPSQLKRAIRTGIVLPATCAAGDLFFKTNAPAGGAPADGAGRNSSWPAYAVASDGTAVGSRTGGINAAADGTAIPLAIILR